MTTTALSSLAQATSGTQTGKAEQARDKLASNMNSFLTMLTAQLKNQDPLSPMDSTEFTNQLVLFAGVEQQITGNGHLEKLLTMQQTNEVNSAVSYIGKQVEVATDKLPLQNGEGRFSFTLSAPADTVKLQIRDAGGTIVRTLDGETTVGRHDVVWDGKDEQGKAAGGKGYSIHVIARDGEVSVPAELSTRGVVTGVAAGGGDVTLDLGGVEVPLTQVRSIKEAAQA